MSKDITIEAVGLQHVMSELDALSKTERNRALKSGLTKGGRLLLTKEKSNLRKSMNSPGGVTGNLLSSMVVKVKRNNAGVLVGFTSKGHHAHLVDRGHYMVVGKSKYHTGKKTRAYMFREKTMEQSGTAAQDKLVEGVEQMIKKYQ